MLLRALFFALIISACSSRLPHLGWVPPFTLTAESGEAFGTAQLKHKVWVANFIFTRCPMICPEFTARMAQIQERSRDLQLVSFSVDPDYDTPAVLDAFAKTHGAKRERWRYLTGPVDAIEKVVVDGMKQPIDRAGNSDSTVHGTYFVLLDGKSDIRGYYPYRDEGTVDAVVRDAALLQ